MVEDAELACLTTVLIQRKAGAQKREESINHAAQKTR